MADAPPTPSGSGPGADIALVWLTVKDTTKDFAERTTANVCGSRKEAGNVRFDLFRSEKEPSTHILFEVYKSKEAAAAHKEQAHFAEWRPWLLDQLVACNAGPDGRVRRQYRAHGNKGADAFRGGDMNPDAHTGLVHVSVKPGTEDQFVAATLKNQAGVRANEPNAIRFDILQQEDEPTKFILFEVFKDEEAVALHKTMEYFLDWRKEVQDMMLDPRRFEKVQFQRVGEKSSLMKVTSKKNTAFYVRAATNFLKGSPDKPPVEELVLSALGEAINVAGAVATQIAGDGLATITKISTEYPEMASGDKSYGCAQIQIVLKPAADSKL